MRVVLGMKSELQRLQRRIRPMTAVVRHLMDDEQIGTEMKVGAQRIRSGRVGSGGGWMDGWMHAGSAIPTTFVCEPTHSIACCH